MVSMSGYRNSIAWTVSILRKLYRDFRFRIVPFTYSSSYYTAARLFSYYQGRLMHGTFIVWVIVAPRLSEPLHPTPTDQISI